MADFWTGVGDWLGLNKGNATVDASGRNRDLLDTLQKQGGGVLDREQQRTGDLRDLYVKGAGAYADATGVNGTEGYGRATDSFHTGPGYQFGLDQGLQALDRGAAAHGKLQSGNSDIDTLKYATGYADQNFNNWIESLQPYNGLALQGQQQENGVGSDRLQFLEDLSSGRTAANNMEASGKEAGQGKLWDVAGNIAGVAGAAFGLNKNPMGGGGGYKPSFGGYGSF